MGLWPDDEQIYKRDDYHKLRKDLLNLAEQNRNLFTYVVPPEQSMDNIFLELGTKGNYNDLYGYVYRVIHFFLEQFKIANTKNYINQH